MLSFFLCVIPLAAGDEDLPQIMYCEPDVAAALAEIEIDPATVRLSPHDVNLLDGRPVRTPLLEWLFASPLKVPLLESYIKDSFRIDWPGECVDAFAQLSRWRGKVVRRGLIGDALEQPREQVSVPDLTHPVLPALDLVFRLGGEDFVWESRSKVMEQLEAAPLPQRTRLALLLHTMVDAHKWADIAYQGRTDEDWSAILKRERESGAKSVKLDKKPTLEQYRERRRSAEAVSDFDPSLPLVGAEEIALAVEEFVAPFIRARVEARKKAEDFGATDGRSGDKIDMGVMNVAEPARDDDESPEASEWSLVLQTPVGLISIGSEHDLEGQSMAPFLLIDWGGDDDYPRLAANSAPTQRVSVSIDLGGDDNYGGENSQAGGFGAGHCGIGMLFDFAGNDTYAIKRNGLGQALFGVGLLYDNEGDDKYKAVEKAQGCAVAGVAMLVDIDGNDRYEIYSAGQGFGGPGGAAALIDRAGSDRYVANDTDIRFPSPQTAKHNVSLAQGAGYGWRGDYLRGLNLSGGVGVLFDGAGNDIYFCGVFGQGVGYWLGTGILLDGGGNDVYTGQWYAQGAAAHFAAGILLDTSGNDSYDATMNVTQGAAHDVSLAALFDLQGDDRYRGGSLGLGASNSSGVGILLDRAGNDAYILEGDTKNSMGYVAPNAPTSIRNVIQGIGLFMDLGGVDGYSASRASNNSTWLTPTKTPDSVLPGVARGIDTETAEAQPRPSSPGANQSWEP